MVYIHLIPNPPFCASLIACFRLLGMYSNVGCALVGRILSPLRVDIALHHEMEDKFLRQILTKSIRMGHLRFPPVKQPTRGKEGCFVHAADQADWEAEGFVRSPLHTYPGGGAREQRPGQTWMDSIIRDLCFMCVRCVGKEEKCKFSGQESEIPGTRVDYG